MNFLAPTAFAFAAAIPVVIVFYLLKRRRTVRLVPSTLLWEKFLAESQANAPFQKLRRNWLLLLQLLLLALLVIALARPYFSGKAEGGGLLVVILDASASMQSTDVAPSRFEKARREALQLVDSLQENDQMLVVQAAAGTEVRQSPTSEHAALRRALESCQVSDAPTRLGEALKLAESTTRDHPRAEIHLFSDGAAPDLSAFESKGLRLVFHSVGQRANNHAIISMEVRANPEDASQRAIFGSVGNYSSNAISTELELRFNDRLVETRPLTIAARQVVPQVFLAPQSRDGIFTLRLTAPDDLPADNQASMMSRLPQPIRVLLVSRGNRFLEKALRAVPYAQVSVASDVVDPARRFDVVVVDDIEPSVWPAGNVLAIHTAAPQWFASRGKVTAPAIVDWKSAHPVLRFASFDNVQISESIAVPPPPWALTLVDSQATPLIVAGELERRRIVWIGFDLLKSTWPLRISFPIFMANALEWLNPANASATLLTVRAGDPFRLGIAEPVAAAQVTRPDGRVQTLAIDAPAREIVYGDTGKQGVYRVRAGTNETVFCVNLMDAAESDTTPRAELQLGKYGKFTAGGTRRANLEVWRWIVVGALFVLLFEWWYYHRRTA